jgi:hypothetical protein
MVYVLDINLCALSGYTFSYIGFLLELEIVQIILVDRGSELGCSSEFNQTAQLHGYIGANL